MPVGTDVFASSSPLAGLARWSVAERRAVTWGPMPLRSTGSSSSSTGGSSSSSTGGSSGTGFVILQPVFVQVPASGDEAAAGTGGGGVGDAAGVPVNPLCGPACAANASSSGLHW